MGVNSGVQWWHGLETGHIYWRFAKRCQALFLGNCNSRGVESAWHLYSQRIALNLLRSLNTYPKMIAQDVLGGSNLNAADFLFLGQHRLADQTHIG